MATTRDSHRPFSVRRSSLLTLIDMLITYKTGRTIEDFRRAEPLTVYGVSKALELIGELTHPRAGHATEELALEFSEARNTIVHEYMNVKVDGLWDLMGKLDQLREEVMERESPPPRP